ncbi:hypothetical protein PUG81_08395 [Erwiniaceae bacterium L1_54_6]|nr:hypothetical protein [Erwiniaceae bacterium L1_54_6]
MDQQQTEAIIKSLCFWLRQTFENYRSNSSTIDITWSEYEELFALPPDITLSLRAEEVMTFLASTLEKYSRDEAQEEAREWWVGYVLQHWDQYKDVLYTSLISSVFAHHYVYVDSWMQSFPLLKNDAGLLRCLRNNLVSWSSNKIYDYELKAEKNFLVDYAKCATIHGFARELLYAPLDPRYFEAIRDSMAGVLLHDSPVTAWTVLNYALLAEVSHEQVRQQFAGLGIALEPILQVVGLLREADIYPFEPTRYSLRHMTPQAIASWRNALCKIIAADHLLRDAALEALCFYASLSDENIVLQAMIQAYPDINDPALLDMAFKHPHALVRRRAAASFDMLPDAAALIRSRIVSMSTTVTQTNTVAALPETLIDDVDVEAMILTTLQQQAGKFSAEVTTHLRVDEEPLTTRFFTMLEATFQSVNKQIDQLTKASSQSHKLDFNLAYRPVSKYEEGKPGINQAKSFSADLCVIIDYQDEGVSYAKRATLIQLKKMQRATGRYPLNDEQFTHLAQQTSSAFLMLMGTAHNDVHLPVLPVSLCQDLRLKSEISPERASSLGRPFADWFFRDVIGLWTGDANPTLVTKAEGDATNRPFDLIRFTINKVPSGRS